MFGLFLKMFLLFKSCHICYWFLCNRSPFDLIYSEAQQVVDPYCFSIKTRLQDLISYGSRHWRLVLFTILSHLLFVSLSCITLIHVKNYVSLSCKLFTTPKLWSTEVGSLCTSPKLWSTEFGSLFEGNFTICVFWVW